jgi:hypothetical protein
MAEHTQYIQWVFSGSTINGCFLQELCNLWLEHGSWLNMLFACLTCTTTCTKATHVCLYGSSLGPTATSIVMTHKETHHSIGLWVGLQPQLLCCLVVPLTELGLVEGLRPCRAALTLQVDTGTTAGLLH